MTDHFSRIGNVRSGFDTHFRELKSGSMGRVSADVWAYENTKQKLKGLIVKEGCADQLLLAAWLSTETVVGPGTTKQRSKRARDANKDLKRLLKPLRGQFPTLTDADFYPLAGVCAIEVIGDSQILVDPGKEDAGAVATGITGGPEISNSLDLSSKSSSSNSNNRSSSSSQSGNSNDNNYKCHCHNTYNFTLNYKKDV